MVGKNKNTENHMTEKNRENLCRDRSIQNQINSVINYNF